MNGAMSATNFDTQDYLKDLARRHPEVVELEQVEEKNNLTPPLPFLHPYPHDILHPHPQFQWDPGRIAQIFSHLNLNIKKLGSSHEGRAIWMVKIGRGAAGELTPRSHKSSQELTLDD